MIEKGDRVIVGVSGGADSMALLSVLDSMRGDLAFDLVVAHLNHGLRGRDADEDAALVKRVAEASGLPYFDKKVDVGALAKRKGLSLEDAAGAGR
jgi:tRNA(Ile)-lysidine synthase